MKHVFMIFFFALVLGAFVGTSVEVAAREWIDDRAFRRGFALSPLSPLIVNEGGGFRATNVDTLRFRRSSMEAPAWQACQWWSRFDLGGTPPLRSPEGVAYENRAKRIALGHRGVLTLEVRTSQEYLHARRADEQWTHLLVQQDFSLPLGLQGLRQLWLSFSLRLLYCEWRMAETDFDPSLHTAQSPFYLYVRNFRPSSHDFGKSLWLGVPSFDARDRRLADTLSVSFDVGTEMYICQLPARNLWGDILFTDHCWHRLHADLLPYLREALVCLQRKGLFLDTVIEDFAVMGMNFGWEVPGTFDVGLQVRGFSLRDVR